MALDFRLARVEDLYEMSCPQLPGWSCSGRRDARFKQQFVESLQRYLRVHAQNLPADITEEITIIIAGAKSDDTRTAA